MAQQEKVLVAKPDGLSSIPSILVCGGRLSVSHTLSYICAHIIHYTQANVIKNNREDVFLEEGIWRDCLEAIHNQKLTVQQIQ